METKVAYKDQNEEEKSRCKQDFMETIHEESGHHHNSTNSFTNFGMKHIVYQNPGQTKGFKKPFDIMNSQIHQSLGIPQPQQPLNSGLSSFGQINHMVMKA